MIGKQLLRHGSTVTTSENGKGYIIDTSSNTHTINLRDSTSAGDIVAVYQSGSNAVTIGRNSSNIGSGTDDITLTSGAVIELVYTSKCIIPIGWIRTNNDVLEQFVEGTGGTETTTGSYKIHTFNSSSNFVVSTVATNVANNVVHIVVADGSGGGGYTGGGGGAGGFREGTNPAICWENHFKQQ